MKNHSVSYGLALIFLAASIGETWAQETQVSCRRSETLIDLFQQRIFGAPCDCDCESKIQHDSCFQKSAPTQKAVPVQKSIVIQKPMPVQKIPRAIEAPCAPRTIVIQKAPRVQNTPCVPKAPSVLKAPSVQKGCDTACGFEINRCVRPRPVVDMLSRLDCSLMRIFPPPVCSLDKKGGKGDIKLKTGKRHDKSCGCDADHSLELPSATPEIEKPRIDTNPFQDDTIQPAPLPSAPSREARTILQAPRSRTAEHQEGLQPVRSASHFFEPVHVEE